VERKFPVVYFLMMELNALNVEENLERKRQPELIFVPSKSVCDS